MKNFLFAALLLFVGFNSGAQNLVPNSSFEEYLNCPNSIGQVDSLVFWKSVLNTPDYFNICAPYPSGIPDNALGSQQSFNGVGHIGLYSFAFNELYREYVGTTLIDTLVVGESYHASMRVSRGNWTNQAYNCAANNRLGMLFVTKPLSLMGPPNYAQAFTMDVIEDTLGWVLLNWHFVADSAYTNLYLGNFFDDMLTDTIVINAPLGQFGHAYYYIDSIAVVCESAGCTSGIHSPADFEFFFDQTNSIVNISHPGNLTVYNALGQLVAKAVATTQLKLPVWSYGLHLCIYTDQQKHTRTLKFFSSPN